MECENLSCDLILKKAVLLIFYNDIQVVMTFNFCAIAKQVKAVLKKWWFNSFRELLPLELSTSTPHQRRRPALEWLPGSLVVPAPFSALVEFFNNRSF